MKKLIFFTAMLAVIVLLSGCEKGLFCTHGKGEIVSVNVSVPEFIEVEAEGAFDVVVKQGDLQSIEIRGHQNIVDDVSVTVIHDRLEVDMKRGCYTDYILTVYITTPDINKVVLDGSGDITVEEFDALTQLDLILEGSGNIYGDHNFPIDNLYFLINGSGNIEFVTTAQNIVSEIEGSGDVHLEGVTTNHEAIIDGSGSFYTYGLDSNNTNITIIGSGSGRFYVNNILNIDISGSGDVYYKGNPQISTNISGSGNVYNAN